MSHHDKVMPRPTGRGWLALLAGAALVGACVGWVGTVRAQEVERFVPSTRSSRQAEVAAVVRERAGAHGVSPWLLERLTFCESSHDAGAVGDRGHSHGIAQLNDRDTGLLGHFHDQGYGTAYSAWESADYLARVASGEWADEGVTLRRWSCWWVVR